MGKVRVGVIGAGSWVVNTYLPRLVARADEVELVGVCRRDPMVLRRLKDEYGFAVASADYREVLAAGIDACIVASPAGLHYEHAKAAIEAGAHVLCEKPFTIDPGDAWRLVEASRRASREVVVAFGWNFQPIVRDARAELRRRGIGPLEHATIHMSSSTRALLSNTGAYPDASTTVLPEPATWTDPALSGGGYAQAQLTHALGLFFHLVDTRVEAAFALTSAPLDAPVELHDAVALRFAGGAIGVLSGGSAHLGAVNDRHQLLIRAIGADGQFELDIGHDRFWVYRPGEPEVRPALPPGAGVYDGTGQLDALLDIALGRRAENDAPAELGACVTEVIALAYRSAASGRLETVG